MHINALCEETCEVFEAMLERQRNMLAICRALRAAVLARDSKTLQARTAVLELLVQDTLAAEATRHELLRRLVEHYKLPPEQQTLSGLVSVIPNPWHRRLEEFQASMRDALEETGTTVAANGHLLRRSLGVVENWMRAFQRFAGIGGGAYDVKGTGASLRYWPPALLDQKG